MRHELFDGRSLLRSVVIVRREHLLKRPLRPVVIVGIAGADFTIPVEAKADFVELFAIACNVLLGGDGGVLPRLNGILFGRQTVGIVAHGVQDVVAAQTLVAGIDVGGDVAEGMPHVQPGSRGIGEHVEHVELRFVGSLFCAVSTLTRPSFAPALFNISEVIFHSFRLLYCFISNCKDTSTPAKRQEKH